MLTKTEQRKLKSVLKSEIERLERAIASCKENNRHDEHIKRLEGKVNDYNKIINKFDI